MTTRTHHYRTVDVPQARSAELLAVDAWAFPTSLSPEQLGAMPMPLDWDRTRGVEDADGELVAIHSSYAFREFPVPGARLPVAGLTWVGVHPGHRRRGLLRRMIDDHVGRSLVRHEAVSVLTAAEPGIYGRFGYGAATQSLALRVPRGAALRDVPGTGAVTLRLELLDPVRHGPAIHAVHGAVDRPGWTTRETDALQAAYLHDPDHGRDGAESARVLLAEREGALVGYAILRRVSRWETTGPRGVVRVQEVVAPDGAVARALWGVLVDLDLMSTVEVGRLTTDDPLTHLLVDVRAAEPRVSDHVWVRLLDVPAALRARRYSTEVDVVLEVHDTLLDANAGRWRLRGGSASAEVTRTDAAADLSLDVRELGSAYLGGVQLAALAHAGLVHELTPGSLARASTAFGWPVVPAASWVF